MMKALYNMGKIAPYHEKEPYEVTICVSQNEGNFPVKNNTLLSTRFCQKLGLLNVWPEYFRSWEFPFLPLGKVKYPDNYLKLVVWS